MKANRIPDASALIAWRKSSYSGSENANCVEVADGRPDVVPVRDSKDPGGPVLVVPAAGWSAFVVAVSGGELTA